MIGGHAVSGEAIRAGETLKQSHLTLGDLLKERSREKTSGWAAADYCYL
jgi:hypothetical protein